MSAPIRVAILGGGTGALATAMELTDPKYDGRFKVTVLQQGWRLGGKGATGRGTNSRIEEHGLHIWLGFYENAFRMIRTAYGELLTQGLLAGCFPTWADAFKKHSLVGVTDLVGEKWTPTMFTLPENNLVPGDGDQLPDSLWGLVVALLDWALSKEDLPDFELEPILRPMIVDPQGAPPSNPILLWGVDAILKVWQLAAASWLAHVPNETTTATLMLLDMALAIARGLTRDVFINGQALGSLDVDFKGWLSSHGAQPQTASLKTNSFLRALHDFVFAFVDGKTDDLDQSSSLEAGCAVRIVLRMLLTYKGAIFWKMQAGMGETVFTPLHKVLDNRGVAFEFFTRVEQLVPTSADANGNRSVREIQVTQQAQPLASKYDPYIRVRGLDCWPSMPKYELLKDGDALETTNFESFWSDSPTGESLTYKVGPGPDTDFNLVVLAIPVGGLDLICANLIEVSNKWRDMITNVGTVATMASQLWVQEDPQTLGLPNPTALGTAFQEPLDTWADMSHLLPREDWAAAQAPQSLFYLCGPLDAPRASKSAGQTEANGATAVEAAENQSLPRLGFLWPAQMGTIVDRYDRANLSPSERYTLSAARTSKFRLKPGESGFTNLYLAGDWTDTGFNAGCIEAAVVSGIRAANAIAGSHGDSILDEDAGIIGHQFF